MTAEASSSPVSLVLRVLPGPAAAGQVVGQVELVATGAHELVRAGDDLAAIVCRLTLIADR